MRTMTAAGLLGAAVLALAGAPSAAQNDSLTVTTVVEGFASPGSMALLPDGSILVTERRGDLRLVRDGVILPEPVTSLPEVYFGGQGGLLDVIIHPDFTTNRLVYLSYAIGTEDASTTRISRGRLEGASLVDVEEVFTASPMKDRPNHYGGRMVFLPDETMLVTLGDRWSDHEQAQLLNTHIGKILRLNADGSIPADNPFLDREGALPEIWSYGHRISQGLAVDSTTGRVFSTEPGPSGGDEFNIIEKAANYGWPIATFGKGYNGALISPYTEYPGMTQPVVVWSPEITPYGLAVYRGNLFASWNGDVVGGGYFGDAVRLRETSPGVFEEQERLFTAPGRSFRDVRVGADGAIYFLTDGVDNGKILRVTPR